VLAWIAGFLVLALMEARLEPARGVPPAAPWGTRYGDSERLLRALGIVLVAALAEELMFRGALFTQLERTRLRAVGAVAVTALAFAALHPQYGARQLVQVLVEGLFYGARLDWGEPRVARLAITGMRRPSASGSRRSTLDRISSWRSRRWSGCRTSWMAC
jgi:hypothetical protein